MNINKTDIRQLTPQDAPQFQRLRLIGLRNEPSAFASSYEEEKDRAVTAIEAQLAESPSSAIFGAFTNNELIGVVALGHEGMRKLAHKGYIWGMFVDAASRQQGVARRLMLEAIAMARTMPDLRQLNLGVNANNAAAIRLYESLGFKAFGHEAGAMLVDGVLHDEVHLSLRL
jgi:ribosomal protein S18 acetylase RimI-like enzyme